MEKMSTPIVKVYAYIRSRQEELQCAAQHMKLPVRLSRKTLKKLRPADIEALEKIIRDDRIEGFPRIKARLNKLQDALAQLDQGNTEPAIAVLREELREHARTLNLWDEQLGVYGEDERRLYRVSESAYEKISTFIKSIEQPKTPSFH